MNPRRRILVVEDDMDLQELVVTYLVRDAFEVAAASTGREALDSLQKTPPDLLVLDVMLPDTDGLTLCREIRRQSTLPIIMMSSRGDDLDKILGLEIGADDYLVKPFNPKELVARVRAALRRIAMTAQPDSTDVLVYPDLRIDCRAHHVESGGREVPLTALEFSLLKTLAKRAGEALDRPHIIAAVWGPDFYGDERTVDVHIRNVRAKLQQFTRATYIQSVRGVGYRFDPSPAS